MVMFYETVVSACRLPKLDVCLPRLVNGARVEVVPTFCISQFTDRGHYPSQIAQDKEQNFKFDTAINPCLVRIADKVKHQTPPINPAHNSYDT